MEQKLKQFIRNKNVCVIATCSKNKPRASTVNYVSDRFTLYVLTSGKSIKVRNIKTNPNISVAIDDQGRQEKNCLQAEGIAEILTGKEAEEAKKIYSQKRDISHHNPEFVDTVLKINLKEIMFTEYTKEGLKISKFNL